MTVGPPVAERLARQFDQARRRGSPPADGWWEATLDLAASWVLQHDGATLPAAEPVDSGAPVVFLVPDDLEAATLVYQPAGTVSTRAPDATYEFEVDEPLTAELSLS